MRPDQVERMRDLAERLADAFLAEADPTEWAGDGTPIAEMTSTQRGDRYWCKRNAGATAMVLRSTLDFVDRADQRAPTGESPDAEDDENDRRIAEAEKRAADAVAQALKRAKRRFEDVGKR